MKKNSIIVAVVIKEENLKGFLKFLYKKHSIKKQSVYIFRVDSSDKFILTFKYFYDPIEGYNLSLFTKNAVRVHIRGTAIYTINGLNKLIEQISPIENGNLSHSDVQINWSDYQDKYITHKNGELEIYPIKRFFL